MVKRVGVMFVVLVILSVLIMYPAYGASYTLKEAWQIVYLNKDGSIDVYDYRYYQFEDGMPPSLLMPYHLGKKPGIYGNVPSYPMIEAYLLPKPLLNIMPYQIKESFSTVTEQGEKLHVIGEDGDFTIQVPLQGTLILLIHYKATNITVVGKDFARTYYSLPTLGRSENTVKHYYTGFVLPQPLNCKDEIYDKKDTICPCFKVIHFIVKSPSIKEGKYHKSCQYVIFETTNMSVLTEQEIDAVYPKYIITTSSDVVHTTQTFQEVERWQKAHATDSSISLKYTWISILSGLAFMIAGGVLGGRQIRVFKAYYLSQIKNLEPDMNMPKEDIYRSSLFTKQDLEDALAGINPYTVPEKITTGLSPEKLEKYIDRGGNIFRGIFFNLMVKSYIQPITEDNQVVGFYISHSSIPLKPYEEKVLSYLKEAAKVNVEKKQSFIKNLLEKDKQNIAHILNQTEPEKVLLPEEFDTYLRKTLYEIRLKGGDKVYIPNIVEISLKLIRDIIEKENIPSPLGGEKPEDIPGALRKLGRGKITMFTIGIGFILSASMYFIEYAIFYNLLSLIPSPTLWLGLPLILPIITLILSKKVEAKDNFPWLNRDWWQEFLEWKKVDKWIDTVTRIKEEELSIYSGINWDQYYLFATLRGKENILKPILRMVYEKEYHQESKRVYTYMIANQFMYNYGWNSATLHTLSSYRRTWQMAHRSGTSSGGGISSGTSFGGGGGAGGGSTGW